MEIVRDAEVIINATSVGMDTSANLSPLRQNVLSKGQVVFETIYSPRNTQLMKDAAECGATVISGLSMFLHQAVAQFKLQTGIPAPLEEMREFVERIE